MLTLAVVGARLAQFTCAIILLGSPLFFLYGLPAQGLGAASALRWPRPFLLGAALVLSLGALVSLGAQTAVMTDSVAEAFRPASLAAVLTGSQFGLAIAARTGLTVLGALALITMKPSRTLWFVVAILGAGVVATFAWTGHGAADDGPVGLAHLASDVLHLLAAAVWLGALAALALLLLASRGAVLEAELKTLHRALEGFSGIGSAVVAVLLATGLANSWFLVGPSHVKDLIQTPYGRVLLAKVALFGVMLGFAAINRFQLTPRFGGALGTGIPTSEAVAALRRSVALESAAAFLVLGLVSVLGTLAPLSTQ
ncbi:MAG: copper homeostasis membrane protein CopD [Phenylobacterium sp.]|uniref:copper homeostasis membrane protein CopD n=1 Tax=Phenylobacterium sp. TaxID=1871053 RepID=UPI0025CC4792|nr:copper homeostasis membrane protein CopD [Phenylobacterium sp.]MBT9470787.1 copper homeostasis membrane protein CopD [Phenylobacterium sp.]